MTKAKVHYRPSDGDVKWGSLGVGMDVTNTRILSEHSSQRKIWDKLASMHLGLQSCHGQAFDLYDLRIY